MIVFFPIGGHLERGFQGDTGDKEFKCPYPGTIFLGRAHVQLRTGKTVGHQPRSKKLRRPGSGFWRGRVNDQGRSRPGCAGTDDPRDALGAF